MSEHGPNSGIARALAGDTDEPDKMVPCMRCGKQTLCPGFLIASVKLWNRDEKRLAEEVGRRIEFITWGELIPCDVCAPIVRQQMKEEYILECTTTQIYLRELRAGKYNPESLQWLRRHGYAEEVQRVLSTEGTTGR